MVSFSPFDVTLWYATAASAPHTEPLSGSVQADVCIVGAGYTGLTTALELAKTGINVVLLERQEIGFGGSGRNAGHCTPTFTHYSLPELRRMLGEPWAERLIERQTRANDRVSSMIRDYQIDCEWVQNGYVMGAPHKGAMDEIRRKVETYNAVGAKTRLLDRDEVEAVTGSTRFEGGWLHEEAGHLNPLGYARGLGRAVIQERGKIFTGSAVTGCERDITGGWKVKTDRGEVVASKVIFTTGAYTVGGWPKLDRTFKIQRVFVAATQILSEETRRTVLPQNTTIHDGRGDIYVYKYNAEGRIVASMFPMGRRGRDMAYTRQVMSERLKWLHPKLREEIRWEYFWFGELDMQYRTVPRFYGPAPGVVALTGLSGRGVPTGSMLGSILSEWALGKPENELALKLEPLKAAPFFMGFAPAMALRYYRLRDNISTKLAGAELPPHA
ncbi:YD repeat-containing protein [Rhizobium sp. AN5]|uniref:NAD(P)/FAD-dependent oxidoreductase n=1 Tax=Rhizobium sp. AN5 TaxID=1855304 RepID=UPI000BD08ED0|nr:FAD-binding oxidoreductase [Rhizobium sp. AN5]SOC90687.1 YD repeat-containing protein [Rhizobium sp. AN5]